MLALLLATVSAITPLGVAEREWHVTAYRPTVAHGRIALHIHNFGEDAHDLQVSGPGGYRSAATAPIEPGADATLRVTLRRPGTYKLVCTLPGHAMKGMHTTIRVR